jgi:poly-gamma-glutamate capsule biosynthesis protein CapA/YwtB (metallophosphatase superfamily)
LVLIFAGAYGLSLLEGGGIASARAGDVEATPAQPTPVGVPHKLASKSDEVTIAWAGDITPGSKYGLPPNSGRQQFSSVKSELKAADITIGNLEGTFGSGGWDKCSGDDSPNCFSFQAPSTMAGTLKDAGFDVLNLANNHALDYGEEGQAETVATLDRLRLRHTGRPNEVTYVQRNGVRIAVLGFAPYKWASPLLDYEQAASQIATAKSNADLVVVAIHAGAEGADKIHVPRGSESAMGEDRGDSRAFAKMAVNAGADLIVGSGPHVPRGIEFIEGKPVVYSTGNFSGWKNFSTHGNMGLGAILQVTLSKNGEFRHGRLVSIQLSNDGVPSVDQSAAAAVLISRLSREDFGSEGGQINPSGDLRAPR